MRILLRLFSLFALALTLSSCKGSSDDGFAFLDSPESPVKNDEEIVDDLQIVSFSPLESPIRVTDSKDITFVVSVNSTAGGVVYTWKLDGSVLFVGTEPFFKFSGASAPGGLSNLEVIAANPKSEASKIFILEKNIPPQITAAIPSSAGNIISCGGGSLAMTVNASDADADGLTYNWLLNGAVHSAYFSVVNGVGVSENTFTPPCSVAGVNTVTVEVSDGYDKVSTSWAVTVNNPTVAQINSYTPLGSPIIIPSSGSQLFSVSATGKDPLSYEWRLNGTPIPGESTSFITLNAASLVVGEHTLTAVVSDADSSDSRDFLVKRNAPPVLSAPSPSTGSTTKINYQSLKTFSINGSDENGDPISYSWTLNGLPSVAISASATGSGHQAILSPSAGLVGTHTLMVSASDGVETAQQSWTININYFSSVCNDLTAGQICTILGSPGYGNGLYPASDNEKIKIRPTDVIDDGSGNLFVTDDINHVVWFFNRSALPITRLGKTVAPGQFVAIIGNGSTGLGPELSSNNHYKPRNPYGVAWDPIGENLFVSLWSDHKVIRIDSTGQVTHDICHGGNGNPMGAEGDSATGHRCNNPANLAYDPVRKYLYVAIHANHQIKMFDLSDPDPTNWTGHYMVGNTSGDSGSANGAVGNSGTRGSNPFALTIDSQGVVYFVESGANCRLRIVNNTASNRSYMGGAVTVNAGQVGTLTGGASCGTNTGVYSALRFQQPRGLAVWENAGSVLGFFVTNRDHDRTTFLNNTASSVTLGGQEVSPYNGDYVWHSTTEAGYGGGSTPARNNPTNEPWGATVNSSGTEFILADRLNFRIRTLNISTANGAVTGLIGEGEMYGYAGGSNSPATIVKLNNPTKLLYDPLTNQLLVSDRSNFIVRGVNLESGADNTVIGAAGIAGNANNEDEEPTVARLRGSFGLAIHGNALLYADNQQGSAANQNCLIRAYNRSGSSQTIFNTSIMPNKVSTIAGDYISGCGSLTGNGGPARSARINRPEGLASDGTNIYIAATQDHCILRVTPDGTLSQYIGSCGNAQDVNGVATGGAVRLRFPSSITMDPRHPTNFFIADQTNQSTNKLKYVNLSGSDVVISGITIANGQIGTVYTGGGYGYAVAAFDNQICFSSGHSTDGWQGSHNVQCRDRDNPIPTTTMLAGRPDGDQTKAGTPSHTEQEGVHATSSYLYTPYGLAFDSSGNLYIADRNNHIVRMVKRWW